MSTVVGVATQVGAFPAASPAVGRVTLDFSAPLEGKATEETVTYLFIVSDGGWRVTVASGGFKALDYRTERPTSGPVRTATLLYAVGEAAREPLVLYQFNATGAPAVPFRAAAVTMSGEHKYFTAINHSNKVTLPKLLENYGATIFFGHSDTELSISSTANHVVNLDDPSGNVDAFSWGAGWDVSGASGGPWFTATVAAYFVPPPVEIVRPPSVDADTFWAEPAACHVGDVFLINNDVLALTWDEPSSSALIAGDTLVLNHTDSDGVRWSMTDIDGWWTLPPVELPAAKRPGFLDGDFPVDGRYEARVISVQGTVMCPPNVSIAVPRHRLMRALDAVRGGALFVVKEPVWAKQAWVYLSDQPKVSSKAPHMMDFEFTLKAVDPIKYHAGTAGVVTSYLVDAAANYEQRTYSTEADGELYSVEATLHGQRFRTDLSDTQGLVASGDSPNPYRRYQDSVPGSGTAALNAGTTTVFPRLYIYGPISNPIVTNTTTVQTMKFLGTVHENETLVADCYWRVVLLKSGRPAPTLAPVAGLAGENRRWMLDLSSQWIGLLPGENLLRLNGAQAGENASVVVAFRSGWLA
jgi:hypothetical protein